MKSEREKKIPSRVRFGIRRQSYAAGVPTRAKAFSLKWFVWLAAQCEEQDGVMTNARARAHSRKGQEELVDSFLAD